MKKTALALLASLLLVLCGYGTKPGGSFDNLARSEEVYHSDTPAEDCYLCSGRIEKIAPSYWGQDNLALISLNTFEIQPVEINRYDKLDGHLIEETAGIVSFGGRKSQNGGFSANLLLEPDRGFATGSMDFFDDATLDIEKAASFLCDDCLNKHLPRRHEQCFGAGVINLNTKEIKMFEESLSGFGIGNFYVDCGFLARDDSPLQMNLLIFYCPIRYE